MDEMTLRSLECKDVGNRNITMLYSISVFIQKHCLPQMQFSCIHLALFTGRALRRVTAATSPTLLLGGLSNYMDAGVAMLLVVA
jgi:hypothetical protein